MTTTTNTTTIPVQACDPETYGDMSSSMDLTHLVVKGAGRARKAWAVWYYGPEFQTNRYPGWTNEPRTAACEGAGITVSCRGTEPTPEVEVQDGDLLEICGDTFRVHVAKWDVPELERVTA